MSGAHLFGEAWPFTRRIKYAGVARMLPARENKEGAGGEKKGAGD